MPNEKIAVSCALPVNGKNNTIKKQTALMRFMNKQLNTATSFGSKNLNLCSQINNSLTTKSRNIRELRKN